MKLWSTENGEGLIRIRSRSAQEGNQAKKMKRNCLMNRKVSGVKLQERELLGGGGGHFPDQRGKEAVLSLSAELARKAAHGTCCRENKIGLPAIPVHSRTFSLSFLAGHNSSPQVASFFSPPPPSPKQPVSGMPGLHL